MLFNIFFRRRSARSSMPVIGFLETVPPSFGTQSLVKPPRTVQMGLLTRR
jgi:hypothetical protein